MSWMQVSVLGYDSGNGTLVTLPTPETKLINLNEFMQIESDAVNNNTVVVKPDNTKMLLDIGFNTFTDYLAPIRTVTDANNNLL